MDVQVNGQSISMAEFRRGSYVPISRNWTPGDFVSINLPMQPVPMVSNPRVADTYGRLAMQRGPLVYALEQIDQGGAALSDIFVRTNGPSASEVRKDLLGGVTVIKAPGQVAERSLGEEPLYEALSSAVTRPKRPVTLTFVPYYAIGNRDPTPMEVWVPISRFNAAGTPASNGTVRASF
jgi:DUF1680 family protein